MEADTSYSSDQMEIGRLLRHTRTSLGQSVEDVCKLLRIRKIYIEAIENSEYSVLPGGPYGMGFVKAYAEHLGLDSAEIARRFRAESNAPDVRSELSFPKPVQESRVPGGAVLLIAALLGIGAYGGWYYLSSQGKTIADPMVDAQIVEPVEEPVTEMAEAPVAENTPVIVEETPAEIAEAPVVPAKKPAAVAEVAETPAAAAPLAPATETAAVPAAPTVDEVGGGRVFGSVNVDRRGCAGTRNRGQGRRWGWHIVSPVSDAIRPSGGGFPARG